MMFRTSHTLLLVTAERVVRADFRQGRLKGLWSEGRPAVDDLPVLVEAALRLGGRRRARRVWVLTTEVWSQSLAVLKESTRGLSPKELNRVLGFEAEPLSGYGPFEATTSHTALQADGYHRHYWVAQLSNWQLSQVEETLSHAGCQLAGIVHPGGLPAPLLQQETTDKRKQTENWQRVEIWPDHLILLHGERGRVATQLLPGGSRAGWQAEAEAWFVSQGEAASRSCLLAHARDLERLQLPENSGELLDLGSDATLRAWLIAWEAALTRGTENIPVIRSAPKPVSAQSQVLMSFALAAVVAAGCFALHQKTQAEVAALQAETNRIKDQRERFEGFEEEIKKKSDELKKLTTGQTEIEQNLERYEAAIFAQRARIAKLLGALAAARPDHLMIEKIEHAGGRLAIVGTSLGPESANELAVLLQREVGSLGWRVGLPRQSSGQLGNAGEPWRFRLELSDIAAAPQRRPAPPAVATQASRSGRGNE